MDSDSDDSPQSFKALLISLTQQHDREVHEALCSVKNEKQQMLERLALADKESARLRCRVQELEAARRNGTGGNEDAAKKRWDIHPCYVSDIDGPTAASPEEPRKYAFADLPCAQRVGSDAVATSLENIAPVDALTDVAKLREIAQEEDEEQKRLAQKYEIRQLGPRARLSYVNLDMLNVQDSVRKRVLSIISTPFFDAAIGLIIVGNAVTIGIETSVAVKGQDVPLAVSVIEHFFLVIYVIELSLRFYAVGVWSALKSGWVKFDSFLVLCGVLDIILKLAMGGKSVEALEKVMLVRMLRLARLARTVRLLVQFRTLWLLVEGLMHSLMTLLWTFVIVVALTYIFAIAGMELIREDNHYGTEYNLAAVDNFSNLLDSMLTLFQFFTLDSVAAIYRPVIAAKPYLIIYFVGFILLVSISLMNLITAIMVESSMRQANDDIAAKKAWESQKKKDIMPQMKALFMQLDADGSGELDMDEIREAPADVKEKLLHVCKMDDLEELFNLLDYDGIGSVDIEAFIDGIMRTNSDKPPELLRLMKQCSDILKRTQHIQAIVDDMGASMETKRLSREEVLVDTFV